MFHVKFYRDHNDISEIVEYLDELREKATTSKHDRVNREKILAYIGALECYGTRVGQPFVKYIEGNLWELRPLANRIFFFYWKDDTFVLLHHFIKKTRKTPPREIERARAEMKDFLERQRQGEQHEKR